MQANRDRYPWRPIVTVVVVAMLLMAVLQVLPETMRLALRYERDALSGGEAWRLLSGHFVHLGWRHLALNVAGLALGTWLFGPDRSAIAWVTATLVAALACSGGLWWFSPKVGWCVGLSGVLHGLMVVGFGGWIMAGDRSAWLFLLAVVGKLGWEQGGGDMPWADTLAGGRVVTAAHLWGAVGGGLFLATERLWQAVRPRV